MSFVLKVKVQLPDGTVDYLPIVRYINGEERVLEKSTKKDAYEWAEFLLPSLIRYVEQR